ncbi:unnamed protein product [Discosporangium mesarthrocarpum]
MWPKDRALSSIVYLPLVCSSPAAPGVQSQAMRLTQAFVRPAGRSCRAVLGWRKEQLSPSGVSRAMRMMSSGDRSVNAAAESKKKKKKEAGPYSNTVILPQTEFGQRANAAVREPELQQFWEKERIYERLVAENPGENFVLHDGPPYANGDLHIGHALNKILKDFINRYQMLRGRKAVYIPGWDCHGLPIELKATDNQQADINKEREGLTPLSLRLKAAEFAKETVGKQSASFRRYGVWGDFENPYLTLQPQYEAAQIEVFGKMFTAGHIYRGRKPVNWSPSSRTALAEAELEYPPGHVSTSVYAAFQVTEPAPALAPYAEESPGGLAVAVWTTTPWTLPANLAVAVNEVIDYSVVKHASLKERRLIVAQELAGVLGTKLGLEEGDSLQIVATLKGKDIAGTKYQHPLYDRVSEVVIGGDYITTETGTGLVHTAPGHGQEDYITGRKYGLPLLSPVDDAGCFTAEAGERFRGLSVLKGGNEEVIMALEEAGGLIKAEDYPHKYPYDWRTKKPTIFRATDQWFASVDRFRDTALEEINKVKWIPEVGQRRITAMVEGRNDWCISRQRNWGVPIPVLYHVDTGEPLLTEETIEHIRSIVAEHGTDAWWDMDIKDLLPESMRDQAEQWQRGTDTMDVWFDSGSSWAGVARDRGLGYPADMYLEGSDQHRGWFQSSLLTSVASNGKAPYRTVLTHGFVLDEKGMKMSKSLGNTLDPKEVIEGGTNKKTNPAYGADVLRLWVSSVDYLGDVCVGQNVIKQVFESYRKLRNTLRYLSGNLFDYNPEADAVPYEDLASLDKYMLGRLSSVVQEVEAAFDTYQFSRATQALQRFAVADLSNFYLDIAKDRLYISKAHDTRRRSCQTVLHTLLLSMATLMAPILPHMAEDVWQTLPFDFKGKKTSIFQNGWVHKSFPSHQEEMWARVSALRNDFNKALEQARSLKLIGGSLEAQVYIYCKDKVMRAELEQMVGDAELSPQPQLTNGVDDLRFLFLVSKAILVNSPEEITAACGESLSIHKGTESGCCVGVTPVTASKCSRCWYHCTSVGTHADHPELCTRCLDVAQDLGMKPVGAESELAAAATSP